ncbi:MAG: nitroreductase family protein [Trueperaceae bacterium]|nr:nitroreductase family protein [Trueperaceae bacterium]
MRDRADMAVGAGARTLARAPATHVGPDRALELVLAAAGRLGVRSVATASAVGSVLAEDVVSDRAYPPFDRAMMDGFAVTVADAGRRVPVVGEVAAGARAAGALEGGTAVAVMTGAPCPAGTQAVVPVEEASAAEDGMTVPAGVVAGQNIAGAGSERHAGAVVLRAGVEITPLRLAVLESVGARRVLVNRAPSLAVITTGDEVVPSGAEPGPTEIRGSNGPMILAMARAAGVVTAVHEHVRDDRLAIVGALVAAGDHDVVVLSGGVSAGRYDLVPGALAAWGAEVVFHKVEQKPGHPLLFATRGNQLVFGLPGNPMASHLGFHRYVRAAIRGMVGLDPAPAGDTGRLAEEFRVGGRRTLFQPCLVARDESGWAVTPVRTKGSADLFGAAVANALVRLEPGEEPHRAGTRVRFEWLAEPVGIGAGPAVPAPVVAGPEASEPTAPSTDPHGDVLAAITERRAWRALADTPVPVPLLVRALEAARWAPSAGNGQPWRFVVAVRGTGPFERLAATLTPGNAWAKAARYLIVVAVRTWHEHPTKPPKPNRLALLEAGLALGNLVTQATQDGLVAHPFDGFDNAGARAAVGVPEGFEVTVMVAIGIRGDPALLDERTRAKDARPRERLPLSEVAFFDEWP